NDKRRDLHLNPGKRLMRFLILSLLLVKTLFAEDIVVPLETASSAQPIYLVPWSATETGQFSSEYLRGLCTVLEFDVNHNGLTSAVPSTAPRERLAREEGTHRFDAEKWRSLGVLYVLRGVVEGQRLHLRLDSGGSSCRTYVLELAGKIATDRPQIHRLA